MFYFTRKLLNQNEYLVIFSTISNILDVPPRLRFAAPQYLPMFITQTVLSYIYISRYHFLRLRKKNKKIMQIDDSLIKHHEWLWNARNVQWFADDFKPLCCHRSGSLFCKQEQPPTGCCRQAAFSRANLFEHFTEFVRSVSSKQKKKSSNRRIIGTRNYTNWMCLRICLSVAFIRWSHLFNAPNFNKIQLNTASLNPKITNNIYFRAIAFKWDSTLINVREATDHLAYSDHFYSLFFFHFSVLMLRLTIG